MAARRIRYEIEPMTLGNMRELGVRSLDVSCWKRHHQAVRSANRWPLKVSACVGGWATLATQPRLALETSDT
jgi:hypothetical protein